MKKKYLLLLILLLLPLFILTGCNGEGSFYNDDSSTVDITMPADFFESINEDDIKTQAEKSGLTNYVINSDNSITYTVTKAEQAKVLKEFKVNLDEAIQEMLTDETNSITDVKYSNNLDKFEVFVDSAKYTQMESLYSLAFYVSGGYYQIFNGVAHDAIDIQVDFIDENGSVIDSAKLSDTKE